MEENRKCDGHCERCNANQRSYCSSQISYYNMQEIAAIKSMLQKLNQEERLTISGEAPIDIDNADIEKEIEKEK